MLKVGRSLRQTKGHPQPPKLAHVARECALVTADFFKHNVVKTSLEVNQRDVLKSPQLRPVPPGLIKRVLVLRRSLIYRDDILHHPVRLSTLSFRY